MDFWREHCVDVTVEYKKDSITGDIKATNKEGTIIKKLYDLKKKNQTQVCYVVGNHDYSMLYFSKRADKFPFPVEHRDFSLSVNGKKFYFAHGYEFEVLANFVFITIEEYEAICKSLCDVRSTTIGKIESSIWSALHLQFLGKTFEDRHTVVKSIAKPPEDRMKELHRAGKSPAESMKPLLKPN